MDIQIKENETKGYAIAVDNGKIAGKMTYSIPTSAFIIIDHTEVVSAFEGKGVGKQMLYKIVEMAREKEIKILPLCPFAHPMFKKLTEIQDVLKQS
ncbi:GNAT family N-acetyltransferase [Xanthomarina sp. F1114]|uniref:GNAT family N-acetyltransferase n=1 Tax=Xanthomarina sp. F1114 TaxID=2996019 RepID=UPI00225E2C3F|nr:GNAT family N-acetyltransferase [Xanthomarina sp. F1114]MCX7546332.1 GNAT family N-acetyltransferase [Xanthomarina sp. F1114]